MLALKCFPDIEFNVINSEISNIHEIMSQMFTAIIYFQSSISENPKCFIFNLLGVQETLKSIKSHPKLIVFCSNLYKLIINKNPKCWSKNRYPHY